MRPSTTSPFPPARLRYPHLRAQPLLHCLPQLQLPLPLLQLQGLPQLLWLPRFLRPPLSLLHSPGLEPRYSLPLHPSRQELRCHLRRSGSPPDKSCPPSFRRCPEFPSIVPASFPRASRRRKSLPLRSSRWS